MAFNFFGTFTTGQFDQFTKFSKLQEQDLSKRISHLNTLLLKVGRFITEYDESNRPRSFTVVPETSYAAKLMLAYKILGGNPEMDMLLRTRDKPVYLTTGTPLSNDINDTDSGYSQEYSNGRLDRGTTRYDRDLGLKVNKIKNWQLEVIKKKRELLEYKIKRSLDYSDSISQEIDLLSKMISSESLDYMIADATSFMFRNGSMNIVKNAADTFGLKIGKPVDVMSDDDQMSAEATGGRIMGGAVSKDV